MKAMIASDLITVRNALGQLLVINVVCAVFIAAMSQSLVAGIGALAAMVPFLYVFSISAYDEMNGWERFRLTLPISRRQMVLGRYAGILLLTLAAGALALVLALLFGLVGAALPADMLPEGLRLDQIGAPLVVAAVALVGAVVLLVAAVTLPLIMRFGMTKATRIVPILMVLLLAAGIYVCGDSGMLDGVFEALFPATAQDPSGSLAPMLVGFGLLLGAMALFAVSSVVSIKLYEQRQF